MFARAFLHPRRFSTVESLCKEAIRKAQIGRVADAAEDFEKLRRISSTPIPDWATVKFSSVAESRKEFGLAKEVLDAHFMATGAVERFARKSTVSGEQVAAAIRRILKGEGTPEENFLRAKLFYQRLIDYRFSPNRDALMRIFVDELISRGAKTSEILEVFSELRGYGMKGPKSITECLYQIVEYAFVKNGPKMAKEIIERHGSALQKSCLLGCVKLEKGKSIEFFDELKSQSRMLQKADVEFICKVAKALNKVNMVISLFELQAHPFEKDVILHVYDTAVEIAGKKGDTDLLQRIWTIIKDRESDMGAFRPVIFRLKHFYKCCNVSMPDDLLKAVKQFE